VRLALAFPVVVAVGGTSEAARNERHRKSDERQQRRGRKDKKGEIGDDVVQTTRPCRGKRAMAVETAVQAAAVMTAAMAVLAVQGRTRRLAEAGRRSSRRSSSRKGLSSSNMNRSCGGRARLTKCTNLHQVRQQSSSSES
jgi:hypothetical protein